MAAEQRRRIRRRRRREAQAREALLRRRQWQGHARSQLLWYEAPAAALLGDGDEEADGGSSAGRAVDCDGTSVGNGSGADCGNADRGSHCGSSSGGGSTGCSVATGIDGADCAAAQVVLGFQRVELAPARSLLHNPLPNSWQLQQKHAVAAAAGVQRDRLRGVEAQVRVQAAELAGKV